MGKTSRVQYRREKGRELWQLGVPSAVAQDMGLTCGANVEWIVVDENTAVVRRTDEPFVAVKKNPGSITRLF